jgi:hypothetical protein
MQNLPSTPSIAKLGETLNEVHAQTVETVNTLEAIRADVDSQRRLAINAVNQSFEAFNANIEKHLAALRNMLGE